MSLDTAISAWATLADDEDRAASLGLTHPSVAKARAAIYRRTVKALEIQRDTGIAVCSCCHKPFGNGVLHYITGERK